MAGKDENSKLAKVFNCTNCGAPVTVRFPGASLSVVCESCHSIIDASDSNHAILTRYYKATSPYKPLLALGARGKLRGREWQVIGFMVRSDLASRYTWREYLLFNPYYGYRWLTEDNGHWNLVQTIKRKLDSNLSSLVSLDGKNYKLFNSGRAQVEYVIGEFYWRVYVGSQVNMVDYILPPRMLSMEKDENEVVWSLGEYIKPEEVHQAFKPVEKLPRPQGVGANQPDYARANWEKMGMLFLIFWGIITCAQIYFTGTASSTQAMEFNGTFVPNSKQADITTPVFTLNKEMSNVELEFSAPVRNAWFYASGELVNNETGLSFPFDKSVEFYFGTDSDGYWSEGDNVSRMQISSVPGGKYYINLDTESGDFKVSNLQPFSVVVRRNVPSWDNYLWITFFLGILPAIAWITMRQVEVARWSNSKFNPYESWSSD